MPIDVIFEKNSTEKLQNNQFIKKYGTFILLAVATLAFWQVAFLKNGMKWDFVDAYLPARYFFSEAVLNNSFPFWNPYMLYGVPFYADLVSVFNPEFWIVANTFGYSNITLQYVFLVYVFLAGICFRYFLRTLASNELTALSLSIAYMLSGFTVGHAQHLGFIIGYALMPLVVASYLQFAKGLNSKSLLRFSLVFLLMVFASYPGLTIITIYLLLVFFVYYLFQKGNEKKVVKSFLMQHILVAAIVLAGSTVLIVAFVQAKPFLERYSGLTLEATLLNPFTVQSFWSLLFPLACTSDQAYFQTDPSMSNAYFGLFGLLLFLQAFSVKVKNKLSLVFLFSAISCGLVALGDGFYLRQFLFDYFPFMNLFKYPAIFRAVCIFGFLTYAALNVNLENFSATEKKRHTAFTGFLILFVLSVIIYSLVKTEAGLNTFDLKQLITPGNRALSRQQALIVQGVVQIILLVAWFFVFAGSAKKRAVLLVLLFAADGIVSTQFNQKHTVTGNVDPVEFSNYLKSEPKGFPIPGKQAIGANSDHAASNEFTWKNNNVFPKRVTFDGLVSFKTDAYYHLTGNYPKLLEAMKKQPVLFFTDDVRALADTIGLGKRTVLLAKEDFNSLKGRALKTETTDQMSINSYSPNHIQLQTETKHEQLLVFQQNYFSGWQVFVDGNKQTLFKSNFALMSVLLPAGKHLLEFRYRNNVVLFAFVFSVLVMLALSLLLLKQQCKERPTQKKYMLYVLYGSCMVIIALTALNRYLYAKNKQGLLPQIKNEFEVLKNKKGNAVTTFLSVASASHEPMPNADYQSFLDENMNVAGFGQILAKTTTPIFAFAWANARVSDEVLALFLSFFPDEKQIITSRNSGLIVARKHHAVDYSFVENFEEGNQSGWSFDWKRVAHDTLSGNCFYTFTESDEWGASLQFAVDSTTKNLSKISVLGDLRLSQKTDGINLVISVKRNKDQLDYYSTDLGNFVFASDEWSRFAGVKNYNFNLEEGDEVHIYFWNRKRISFDLAELKVKMEYK
ncbi:YfhO family protein [uncultured Draconibacterium sp.]|uniref:YfhO family protein n=1 Tax=uncultured Draconibacterium sp. TaxID=1573823 RepID=UPI00325FE6F4